MKAKYLIIMMICILLGVVSACSNTTMEEKKNDNEEEHVGHVIGDIREETTGVNELPKFLDDKPDDMKLIYTAVANHKELLEKIPCYCGCGEAVNHKNNYDCFIFENKSNGAITWDDHGTKCGVCLEIASQSVIDYSEGKSIKEIRKAIDKKYENGYAKPTPTPEV
ncbi:PCYCGC motif-containing (lipo)protein [Peribacillus huizhouensis]|uniref:Bacterioferritin-associated ferredoxin n=1 Tax=Peribacillus huizhouensis TaxID=1501239 RepID=A0ABR6CKD0_9BACI|nr:PCYCGC motif-containing (lipo)protein [Peribacillus huizhouensis]MBA9025376.1 bacterioferritin-associated ferredoxin [Peribacillus huizhouensis]